MKNWLLRWVPSVMGGWQMYAMIALAAAGVILMLRMHWIQEGREQILREDTAAIVRYVEKVHDVVRTVTREHTLVETKIETVYQTIEKEVPGVPTRAACNVTAGWMRVHDRAAGADERLEPGTVADTADTGVTEAQALGEIAANYKTYHQIANDLTACRAAFQGVIKIDVGKRR